MILTAGRFGIRATYKPLHFEFRSNVEEPDRWLVEYAGGHPTASGQVMTERTAVQLSGVYAAVNLISHAISTSPRHLYQRMSADETRLAVDHPLYPLLRWPPNEEMTQKVFWDAYCGHLLLWGNGYAEIERNGAGEVVALWLLRPDRTFPRRLNGVGGKPTGQLVYAARSSAGPEVILQPYQVLHTMGYSYDGLRGLSPVALHRESHGLTMAATDYGARFFGNDGRPGGILTTPQKLKPEAAKRLKESWEEAHRGGAQAWRTAVLENDVKWQSIGMPNEDAQWLGTRTFQLSEIARIYNVPLHKLAELSHATFSNIEHQSIEFIRDGVEPWAEAIEQEIERKLLSPADQKNFYVEHDFSAQLRGDAKSRNEADAIEFQNGFANQDEIRKTRNRNPLPNGEGKTYYILTTLQTTDRAINPPDPPPAVHVLPGQVPPIKAAKSKTKRELADQMRCLIRAFVPAFENVRARIERKEQAVLAKGKGFFEEEFLRTHRPYVCAAYLPVLQSVAQSMGQLACSQPLGKESVLIFDVEFLRSYAETLSHRLTGGMQLKPELIAPEETTRAANCFILETYKAAGVKRVEWIPPDESCEACRTMAAAVVDIATIHPPLHVGCECMVVPCLPDNQVMTDA